MRAVVVDRLLGDDLGGADRLLGRLPVALLPQEDVVVVAPLAVGAARLAGEVLAQHGRVRLERLERIGDDRQLLVLDLDELDRVGGDVAVVGDDEGDLLALEQHLAVGQHHLLVAGQRRHPVQVQRLEVLRRQHGQHAGQGEGGRGVDRGDAGMGVGAAHEVAEQHAGQLDVVDIVALALREPDVLDALARAAEALQLLDPVLAGRRGHVVHSAASFTVFISAAAARMDFTMFW